MLKEKLLALKNVRIQRVDVPGLDESIYVRRMNARQRDQFDALHFWYVQQGKPDDNFRARFLVLSICDEHGNLVYTPNDIEAIGELDSDIVGPLFNEASKLNGMDIASEEAAKGNSEGRSTASCSDSPSTAATPIPG